MEKMLRLGEIIKCCSSSKGFVGLLAYSLTRLVYTSKINGNSMLSLGESLSLLEQNLRVLLGFRKVKTGSIQGEITT